MRYEDLRVEHHDDGVVVIKLNRPTLRNALRATTLNEMAEVLETTEHIRVAIVAGSRDAFSAGADLREVERTRATGAIGTDPRHQYWTRLRARRVPLIAAVNGLALGGGCELVLHADIAVAGESARFGQPEAKLGLIPGAGGTQRLTRVVGKSVAMKMILAGLTIDADEALRRGLVAEVVPDQRTLDRALELAQAIAANAPLAVRAARDAIDKAFEVPLTEGLAVERALFEELFETEDLAEGLAAFFEKRSPRFAGR